MPFGISNTARFEHKPRIDRETISWFNIKLRIKNIAKTQALANEFLAPLAKLAAFQLPKLSEAEYLDFVDHNGRILHPGKRGAIGAHKPPALRKLGLDLRHWTMQVKGIGSGYWRAVGTMEQLMEKAAEIGQNWLCDLGKGIFWRDTRLGFWWVFDVG